MSMPSYWFDPMVNAGPLGGLGGNAATGQPAMSADQINASMGMGPGGAGAQNQAVLNNNFNNFGALTNYYSSLGAAYGRATGGFGGEPGRVGTISNPGTSNPGYLDGGKALFNTSAYLQQNPDVAAAGVYPTAHWFEFGEKEGRQGGGDAFNPQEYLLNNRDVAAAGVDPLQHWMTSGYKEGRQQAFGGIEADDWSGYFNQPTPGGRDAIAAAYLQTNPDVFDAAKASGKDPTTFGLEHLWNYGVGEGRTGFDNAAYLAQNPDVAAAGVNPFQHYVNYGYNEGRQGAWAGGGDDYWGRGYMASDDPYGYGDPTGVGGSGYGDGFGGYGNAENNPWPAPPGANVADPKSFFVYSDPGANPWQDTRSAFYNDITSNPDRMYDMAVRGYLELKNDPTGRQGVFEAMFNQKAARQVLDPLRADYFPTIPAYLRDYANTTATLRNNPELLAKLYGEIGRAYSSNITQGATDWASGKVAANSANRTTETYKSPVEGERFFIKNVPNLYDGLAAGYANRDWLLGVQQQLPDYQWPQ